MDRTKDQNHAGASAGPSNGPGPRVDTTAVASSATVDPAMSAASSKKKKKNRSGKKRRNRRQSFIAPSESVMTDDQDRDDDERPSLVEAQRSSAARLSFYRLKEEAGSSTSLDDEHLYDHRYALTTLSRENACSILTPGRDYGRMRARRRSNSMRTSRPSGTTPHRHSAAQRPSVAPYQSPSTRHHAFPARYRDRPSDDEDEAGSDDRSPLLGQTNNRRRSSETTRPRRVDDDDFDVNNPPSVPTSPKVGALGDVMIPDDFEISRSPAGRDLVIDIDPPSALGRYDTSEEQSPRDDGRHRRNTQAAEDDVCFPGHHEVMSEIGEDPPEMGDKRPSRRRRRRKWPDLAVLDEWSREEKEDRQTGNMRAKKITEPVMVGGRLRAAKQPWHRQEDDAPYRYTYFNESFDATIHSRTISELCQFGASYKELFNPEAAVLSDSSEDEDTDDDAQRAPSILQNGSLRTKPSLAPSEHESVVKSPLSGGTPVRGNSVDGSTPVPPLIKPKRYGPRPTFWLDVLQPTEQEMKVLAKSFGIHQLTAEDIMLEEPREKVELFQNYYFVNYRSFEQDENSSEYMEPINIYVVVFRDGVISVSGA